VVESSALQNPSEKFRCAYRPEQEGKWALPQYEFGLDVMALAGGATKSIGVYPIHQQLQQRGLLVSAVSVTCWNAMTS